MENGVYLLLGSNLGNRKGNLLQARNSIQNFGTVLTASSLYQTQAWGNPNQPDFLNQIIQIAYKKSPNQLLKEILAVENEMGRLRTEKWGPRIIDIDILFFGSTILKETNLIIPHPEIAKRRFTLLPLVEIIPDFFHPLLRKSSKQLLEECNDQSVVELYKSEIN
jgi:2-amino-4-hydroxy-6-hydroxymethyldihydropteridine diphosphokinase